MPKIIIKEIDNTKAVAAEYTNFSIVIPGYVGKTISTTTLAAGKSGLYKGVDGVYYHDESDGSDYSNDVRIFDEFGIYECNSQSDFELYVGFVDEEAGEKPGVGNQFAYEALGLGYTVIYKMLDKATEYGPDKKKGIEAMTTSEFWEPLKDKSTYDFRLVAHGLKTAGGDIIKNIENQMISLVHFNNESTTDTGRGDCVALCDIDSSCYIGTASILSQSTVISNIKSAVSGLSTKSKYAAAFAPVVTYAGLSGKHTNKTMPASFHYIACFAKARENNFAEWYAAAGYTRGVCDFTIVSTGYPFGEGLIDALEPRSAESGGIVASVNVITKIKGNYYLWGNRTLETLGTELKASHFLNVRQLCCTLKKQIYVTCKSLTFDPNSDLLWINFCNAIRPTLEKMKANQGISDYKFVKEATSKKATLKALIRIVPIEAVEDFDIGVTLEDSLTGTVISED